MKAYFPSRLDGCLGQSFWQPAYRADVVDAPVSAEDDGQRDRALDFVQTGCFGVFVFLTIENRRFQFVGHDEGAVARSRWPAANTIRAVAEIAITAIIVTRPASRPDSASRAGAA